MYSSKMFNQYLRPILLVILLHSKVKMLVSVLHLFSLLGAVSLAGATTFHSSGASVQLFEWSWADVANECETYLSKKGFKAVQISPPQEHIQGSQWWTRYQPVSYNLVSRSGNEDQFKDMVKRCKAVNVAIVADAVINHMAAGSGTGIAGSKYGSRSYPMYNPEDFHHDTNNVYTNCQVNNYNDKHNVQYCDLSGLPDLYTASSYVQTTLANYINKMIGYGISGIRVDAAKHQDDGEMSGILKKLPSGFYVGQEVIGSTGEAVQPSMYYSTGQVSEFYYADDLDANIIPEGKMVYLQSFGEAWGLMPDQYAVGFLDNHDTQRNGRAQLTYKNGTLYTFANMFMLSWPYAQVRVMSSYYFTNTDAGPPSVGIENGKYCQDGKNWVCEHRINQIGNMVAWRNAAGKADIANWVSGTANQIAFSRNSAAYILFNRDSHNTWTTGSLHTSLPAGVYCNVAYAGDSNADQPSSCKNTVTVDSSGNVSGVQVAPLSAVAIHIHAKK